MEGYNYTWVWRRGKHDAMEERLDHGLASWDWFEFFPNFRVENGLSSKSDHSPIVIGLHVRRKRHHCKSFRFENSWLLEPNIEGVVKKSWYKDISGDFLSKLNTCTDEMNSWNRKLRGRFRDQIEKCEKELEKSRQSHDPQ